MTGGRLAGKVALITGATGGIGAGIAQEFALAGASVFVHGRFAHEEEAALARLLDAGIARERLAYGAAELTDAEQCRELPAAAARHFGGLDVVVNNAGDFRRGTLETATVALWDTQMAVNVRAPFIIMQASVPLMKARGGGAIVNIGSINAYVG